MPDLNAEVMAQINEKLDRAQFKGITQLTDHHAKLVFEQQGVAYDLEFHSEQGLAIWTKRVS